MSRITIECGRWHAWTMFPGYVDAPYRSPIYIEAVEPLGGRRLRLRFYNAGYAEGVRGFEKVLRTVTRNQNVLVAAEAEDPERIVVIHEATESWLHELLPRLA